MDQLDFLSFREKLSYANISHQEKRKEWASSRMAIKEAMDALNIPYPGFFKDEHGKSQVMKGGGQVSLSHTQGYAGAIFHRDLPVGIDMDLVREKNPSDRLSILGSKGTGFPDKGPRPLHHGLVCQRIHFQVSGKKKEFLSGKTFYWNLSSRMRNSSREKFEERNLQIIIIKFGWKKIQDVILTYTIW